MRGNGTSFILGFICIVFVLGSVYSFATPYETNQLILVGDNLGILSDLTIPFHTSFPWRSFNQSIDIAFTCTNGSLDIIIYKSVNVGGNTSPYYDARNVSSLVLSVVFEPSYYYTVNIILETNYGDAWMDINMYSHWWGYNDSAGLVTILVALPFGLGSYHYAPKESKNEKKTDGIDIS